tara:strand:- start:2070 stop:2657 length:588 start_codon:yes stop_codon:yes gene_type:complete
MASTLGYSELSELNKPKNQNYSKTKKNREAITNKTKITSDYLNNKESSPTTKITAFDDNEEDNVDQSMFKPDNDEIPNHPIPARITGKDMEMPPVKDYTTDMLNVDENDTGLPSKHANSYDTYSHPTNQYMAAIEPMQFSRDELNEKLTYMIHLLEEQHDEKIKSVSEEVILYGFLGVFVIYVLDSFTKIGKYVR